MGTPPQDYFPSKQTKHGEVVQRTSVEDCVERKASASPESKDRIPRELPALTISSPSGVNSPTPVVRKIVKSGPKITIHGEDLVQEASMRLENVEPQFQDAETYDAVSTQEAADVDDAGYQSESSGDWFITPEVVHYTLHLSCPGIDVPSTDGHLRLNNRRSYADIEKQSSTLVETARDMPTDIKVLNFRHGYCVISTGKDDIKRKVTVTNLEEWTKMCLRLARDFHEGNHRKFKLSIYREYFELSIRPANPKDNFAADKRVELKRLMRQNLDEKDFINRSDLSKYTSDKMINAIVSRDPCWGSSPHCVKSESLVQEIKHKGARRLLAMCLLAEIDILCLKKLIEKGYNDISLPLASSGKALSVAEICCKRHEWQLGQLRSQYGSFQVAEFNVLGAHQELHSQSIVPVIPVDRWDSGLVSEEEQLEGKEEDIDDDLGGDRSARDRSIIGEGTHGWVYRVKIDPHQHSLSEVST